MKILTINMMIVLERKKLPIKSVKIRRDKSPKKKTQMIRKYLEKMFSLLVIMEMQVESRVGLSFHPPEMAKHLHWIITSITGGVG